MSTFDLQAAAREQRVGRGTRAVAYWAPTLLVAVPSLGAGLADLGHAEPLFGILLHLGYPPYFATLLGLGKIVGAVVLVAPRSPLAKEWAYAALACDYVCATASHLATGDGAATLVGPIVSLLALVLSWRARPATRRLGPSSDHV